MKKITLLGMLVISSFFYSQVGINTENPDPSSDLTLGSTNKGFLGNRVALNSTTDQVTISNPATGLLVYNTGAGSLTTKGYYYWDGFEWKKINSVTSEQASISAQDCSSATLSPSVYTQGVPYTGTLTIPYTGGNGSSYETDTPINSTGVTGLIATLQSGSLNNGNGNLIYKITGTPNASSPTKANFAIPSQFGAGSCSVSVGDEGASNANIVSNATLGPLKITSDNGANGYHRSINTPDGKFSVRVFVPTNTIYGNADLQIRNNTGSNKTLMWNGAYLASGADAPRGNATVLVPNAWAGAGHGATTFTSVASNINIAWGDPDVYYDAGPELRIYTWTTTDANEKTVYTFRFMLGAASNNIAANVTNCPGGTCTGTKAYFIMDQVTTNE